MGIVFTAVVILTHLGKPKQKVKGVSLGAVVSLALSIIVGAAHIKLCCHMQCVSLWIDENQKNSFMKKKIHKLIKKGINQKPQR